MKDSKRAKDMMCMLGLSEVIDQWAMVNSVDWYGQVFIMEDGHVLRSALTLWLKVEERKGG